jgi:2-desacetyl-2-hydroxyethyl bacteriochlorophyllide A dehydrogenase
VRTEAIIITKPGRVDVQEVEIPEPSSRDLVVRTLYSGISVGTERHYISGAYGDMGQDVEANYPFATGYQRCGVVEHVGSDVDQFCLGDLVILGRSRLSDPHIKGSAGHTGIGVCNAQEVYRLPGGVDPEEAAFWVMVGVGLHGSRLSRVKPKDVVAVIGLGMIGQMAAQAARRCGATVIASDSNEQRVRLGASSADTTFLGEPDEFANYLLTAYPDGVDIVIDTGSKVIIWDTCMRMVKREGTINLQGYYPGSFLIDSYAAHVHRVTAVCPSGYDEPETIGAALGTGEFAVKPLITHRFRAGDAGAAYEVVMSTPWEMVGGVIDWTHV